MKSALLIPFLCLLVNAAPPLGEARLLSVQRIGDAACLRRVAPVVAEEDVVSGHGGNEAMRLGQ